MPTQEDIIFGKIAIKNRIVDEASVRRLLGATESAEAAQPLGKLLLDQGLINPEQFKAISTRVQQLSVQPGSAQQAGGPAADGTPAKAKAASRGSRGEEAAATSAPAYRSRSLRVADVARMDFGGLHGQSLDAYLEEARKLGASDFHFHVDSPPFVRLHGELVFLKHPSLTPEYTKERALAILDETGRATFEKNKDYDFAYEASHGRYRANVCVQRKGIDAVFRIIPRKVPTIEELHLPEVVKEFTRYRQGIVLITGPTGTGKTATMVALIDLINEKQHDHIVTVEDPIEYVLESKNCNVNQRQVHRHTDTYVAALRSAMRSDPDYICIAELRDLETVSTAVTAAETGHLVLATLPTTNAVRSIDRLIDIFPPKEQEQIRAMVSESLRGIISQKLIPRADGMGREPACEILFATAAVGNMIREKKTFQLPSVLQTGSKQGMVTMDDSIQSLLQRKLITRESALYFADHKDRFKG